MIRLGTSTTIGFNRPYGRKEEITQVIRMCAEAGYRVLDMNFHDCACFKTQLYFDDWQSWVDEIANTAAKYGVEFSQSHLHFYDFLNQGNIVLNPEKEELIRRCMIGSSMLGVKWAVTHAATDFLSVHRCADSFQGNVHYFSEKLYEAEKMNLSIALENLWDLSIAPKKRYTAEVDELVELIDALKENHGNIGACWDFEHASIMGQEQTEALRFLGKRLKATHVSDHYGIKADHQLPYFGETNWEEFINVLKEIEYEGDFVYETHRYTQNMPDELLPEALRFSVVVGNYLLRKMEGK